MIVLGVVKGSVRVGIGVGVGVEVNCCFWRCLVLLLLFGLLDQVVYLAHSCELVAGVRINARVKEVLI